MTKVLPIIMAGGSGSRLWPLSRGLYPKQFLSIQNDKSMLQNTILRLKDIDCFEPIIICNEEHRFVVAEQLREINKLQSNIILEPVGRNTAPAIALAAIQSLKKFEDDVLLLVLAADHVIKNNSMFTAAIENAISLANNGNLVTFGIVPTSPETGYGYIRSGQTAGFSKLGYIVDEFVEKPDLHTAEQYLKDGNYYWNSGMFLFSAKEYLSELEKHRADIYSACLSAMEKTTLDLDFIRIDRDTFSSCPEESIDYAVMEKTSKAVVVPMDAGWSDVGSWSSLWEISDKDDHGNVNIGDVINLESINNYIHSDSMLIATIGVNNLAIIQTKDAILISDIDKVQKVKEIVNTIKLNKRSEYYSHREVYRPWGKYDSIDDSPRFKVHKIHVKPGEELSMQMHFHRAEHWIVVQGTAEVLCDDKCFLLTENQSYFIPAGSKHQLKNCGKMPLEVIEVQTGSYLYEDDIVRISDKYGR